MKDEDQQAFSEWLQKRLKNGPSFIKTDIEPFFRSLLEESFQQGLIKQSNRVEELEKMLLKTEDGYIGFNTKAYVLTGHGSIFQVDCVYEDLYGIAVASKITGIARALTSYDDDNSGKAARLFLSREAAEAAKKEQK